MAEEKQVTVGQHIADLIARYVCAREDYVRARDDFLDGPGSDPSGYRAACQREDEARVALETGIDEVFKQLID